MSNNDSRDSFIKWFWTCSRDSDKLIKDLNRASFRHGFVTKQGHPSFIYGVVVHDYEDTYNWRLCKIGFTEGFTQRKENVAKTINKTWTKAKPETIFELRKDDTDKRRGLTTETWVRKRFGFWLDKELAKELRLPCPTEWVLTHQRFIKHVKTEAKKKKIDNTDLFNHTNFHGFGNIGLPKYIYCSPTKQQVPVTLKKNKLFKVADGNASEKNYYHHRKYEIKKRNVQTSGKLHDKKTVTI